MTTSHTGRNDLSALEYDEFLSSSIKKYLMSSKNELTITCINNAEVTVRYTQKDKTKTEHNKTITKLIQNSEHSPFITGQILYSSTTNGKFGKQQEILEVC